MEWSTDANISMNKLRDMIYTDVLLNLCAIVPRIDGVHSKQVWVPGCKLPWDDGTMDIYV